MDAARSAIIVTFLLCTGLPPALQAQGQGQVRSRNCPYSCDDAGIARSHCRDWKEGSTCFVEDSRPNTRPAGSGPMRDLRGVDERRVSEDEVAYRIDERLRAGSGVRLELPREPVDRVQVRLRREGNNTDTKIALGYGESGARGEQEQQVDRNDAHTLTWPSPGRADGPLVLAARNGDVFVEEVRFRLADGGSARGRLGGYDRSRAGDDEAARRCRDMDPERPRFEIEDVQRPSRDFFSDRVRISGSLSGECIQEAGYYEDGRLRESIRIPLDDRRQHERFTIEARERGGELRAYTVDGRREVLPVEDALRRR